MVWAIDRIVDGVAICESLGSDDNMRIELAMLPEGVKEGDIIRQNGDSFVIDTALTNERKKNMTERMNKLFGKAD
jgi:hypothetical protein